MADRGHSQPSSNSDHHSHHNHHSHPQHHGHSAKEDAHHGKDAHTKSHNNNAPHHNHHEQPGHGHHKGDDKHRHIDHGHHENSHPEGGHYVPHENQLKFKKEKQDANANLNNGFEIFHKHGQEAEVKVPTNVPDGPSHNVRDLAAQDVFDLHELNPDLEREVWEYDDIGEIERHIQEEEEKEIAMVKEHFAQIHIGHHVTDMYTQNYDADGNVVLQIPHTETTESLSGKQDWTDDDIAEGDPASYREYPFESEEVRHMIAFHNNDGKVEPHHMVTPPITYDRTHIFPGWLINGPAWKSAKSLNSDNEVSNILKIPAVQRTNEQSSILIYWLMSHWQVANVMGYKKCAHMFNEFKYFCFEPGENIITEGERGLTFYIIISGETAVIKDGIGKVATLGKGKSFGEVALQGKDLRTATVQAVTFVETLSLHKVDYDHFVRDIMLAERRENFFVLKDCKLFDQWPRSLIDKMSHTCSRKVYEAGSHIFRQGDPPDNFYILLEGSVNIIKEVEIVCRNRWPMAMNQWSGLIRKTTKPFIVQSLNQRAQYFGELSIMKNCGRQASAIALVKTTLLVLDKLEFLHMLDRGHPFGVPVNLNVDDNLKVLESLGHISGGPSSSAAIGDAMIYPNKLTPLQTSRVTPRLPPDPLASNASTDDGVAAQTNMLGTRRRRGRNSPMKVAYFKEEKKVFFVGNKRISVVAPSYPPKEKDPVTATNATAWDSGGVGGGGDAAGRDDDGVNTISSAHDSDDAHVNVQLERAHQEQMKRLKELADTDKEFMANFKAQAQDMKMQAQLKDYYHKMIHHDGKKSGNNNNNNNNNSNPYSSFNDPASQRRQRSLSFNPASHSTPSTYSVISKSIEKLRDPNAYPAVSGLSEADATISFTPVMRGLKSHPRTKIRLGPQDHIPLNATLTSLHSFNANGRRVRTSTIASLSRLQQMHELAVHESLASSVDESVSSKFGSIRVGHTTQVPESMGLLDLGPQPSLGSLQQRSSISHLTGGGYAGIMQEGSSMGGGPAFASNNNALLMASNPKQLEPNIDLIKKPKLSYKDVMGL